MSKPRRRLPQEFHCAIRWLRWGRDVLPPMRRIAIGRGRSDNPHFWFHDLDNLLPETPDFNSERLRATGAMFYFTKNGAHAISSAPLPFLDELTDDKCPGSAVRIYPHTITNSFNRPNIYVVRCSTFTPASSQSWTRTGVSAFVQPTPEVRRVFETEAAMKSKADFPRVKLWLLKHLRPKGDEDKEDYLDRVQKQFGSKYTSQSTGR